MLFYICAKEIWKMHFRYIKKGVLEMAKYDDFDLKIKTAAEGDDDPTPRVSSRYLCTPGSCWDLVCFTTTIK